MKNYGYKKFLPFAIFLFPVFLLGQPTQTSITIYNDNLGVVNEVRPLSLEKGVSLIKITDVPSQIDPTSVHIKLNGLSSSRIINMIWFQ